MYEMDASFRPSPSPWRNLNGKKVGLIVYNYGVFNCVAYIGDMKTKTCIPAGGRAGAYDQIPQTHFLF